MKTKYLTVPLALGALAFATAACGEEKQSSSAAAAPASQSGGGSTPKPEAEVSNLSGKSTDVALDAKFVKALGELDLEPAPVGDATVEDGTLSVPITGGDVKYFKPGSVSPYVQGMIEHEGNWLSLTGGDTKVQLTDFVVNPGNSKLTGTVKANGKVAAENAPLFFLDGSDLEPLKTKGDKAILEGTEVTLTEEAADLLNKTFEVDALEKGVPIGDAKITLNTK